MEMWHSRVTAHVRWSGGGLVLRKGQTIADQHPLRIERPDLFDWLDVRPELDWEPDLEVERATRAPGEMRRGPGRPRKDVGDG
jgi:hypothetical protein